MRDADWVSPGQCFAILKNDVAEAALTTAQATLTQVSRGSLASELEAAAAHVQQTRVQLDQRAGRWPRPRRSREGSS